MNKKTAGFKKIYISRAILYVLLIALTILCIIPFIMMLVNATRSAQAINNGFTLIPSHHFSKNFKALEDYIDVWKGMRNSAIIALTSTILTAYFSTMTAYGFQFYKFKGKSLLFGFLILMMMVPQQLGLLGYYDLNLKLGLLDNYLPLIIPSMANIAGMFLIRQYMASVIPFSLIEAARIDGSSEIRIFHKIILPLSAPATATMSIFAFVQYWNDYIRPLVLIFTPDKKTLPVLIGSLRGARVIQQNFGVIYAAVSISVLPIIIFFIIFSRYIISSITAGSVKG